mmetsp:Transcript_42254/g.125371  ORF Transcript_42254/g.125371 Transcript_42254/m.125371 type:complete len:279 (+) Transcript_42254:655-1491(+)
MPSASDLPRTRATPTFSSVLGPSRTSITSPGSALRRVFAWLISKSLVMAMPFTTVRYCCRKATKRCRPMPPASMCRQSSSACSGGKLPGPPEPARCPEKAASEMRPPEEPASCSKSCSRERPFSWTSRRSAAAACARLESRMALHADRTASTLAVAALLAASPLCSSFWRSRLASTNGLLACDACGISFRRSVAADRTARTASVMRARSFSASSRSERGVPKVATSSALVSGAAASSKALSAASIASAFAASPSRRAPAALRSRASRCAFLSAASLLL